MRPGERVGIWLSNCPEFISALFGTLRAGAVVVPINNFLKADEVDYILDDAGIDVLITEAAMDEALARLRPPARRCASCAVEDFAAGAGPTGEAPAGCRADREDLAVIIYTSGTTGHPKGAMLTHGNLLHNVESCRQVLRRWTRPVRARCCRCSTASCSPSACCCRCWSAVPSC